MAWVKVARGLYGAAMAVAAASAASAASGVGGALKPLQQIAAAVEKEDCETVLRLGVPLLDRRPVSVGAEQLPLLYHMVATCELRARRLDKGYAYVRAGTLLENSSDELWLLRLLTEGMRDDWHAAVATLEAMSQGRGAVLNALPLELVYDIQRRVKAGGDKALYRRLLRVLSSEEYYPEAAYGPLDEFRTEYAALLVDARDLLGARKAVAQLQTPRGLAHAMLDPRLRALVPPTADVRAAAEASLERRRQAIGRFPDRLGPLVLAAGDLRLLGRSREAVELLETARPKIADKNAFADRDRMLNWWWQGLASSYVNLGEYALAMAAYRNGAGERELGSLNVSQLINMAQAEIAFGHADEALKTLAAFDEPGRHGSPFGEMQMHANRGCAYSQTGQRAKAEAELAFVKAHEKDAPGALSELLLCLGDMDAAAASYIRRLADPDQRVDVLLELSDYDDPPVAVPEGPAEEALTKLAKRADVIAAAKGAGGTLRFKVQAGEL